MTRSYPCLPKQTYTTKGFELVPIRNEDKYDIMDWRNQQIYHLRQETLLNKDDQDVYFESIISKLFSQSKPNQILFSYLKDGRCLGYGGLVHINWRDRNAELSFIMETRLEEKGFEYHWGNFLTMIEEVAFGSLQFHKIFTYAFNLRPLLYDVLVRQGFFLDAILKEHTLFNENFIDVYIHAKIHDRSA